MNKIKVAKELIKLAKSLVASDIDEQTQARLDEAEKQGKKYILHHEDRDFWRIMACKNFSNVQKGDFGGIIESEKNLSHDGDCWVYDNAIVFGSAQISEDARVYDTAQVSEDAKVYGCACIEDHGTVYGNACIYGNAYVCDNSLVQDNAQVFDYAQICDNAVIYGDAKIFGNAQIWNNAEVDYDVKDKTISE